MRFTSQCVGAGMLFAQHFSTLLCGPSYSRPRRKICPSTFGSGRVKPTSRSRCSTWAQQHDSPWACGRCTFSRISRADLALLVQMRKRRTCHSRRNSGQLSRPRIQCKTSRRARLLEHVHTHYRASTAYLDACDEQHGERSEHGYSERLCNACRAYRR